ncbi:hypothetical protein Taro_037638 [Colocasia esculenta]|uniref:Formyl transferase N-terminal domain-containing protein n=1 Tax=Colocasia esculenta TaxID=4460 RepID=A0A843WDF5_COLES|nr:hypothetical protein [Colocasia esculenta]
MESATLKSAMGFSPGATRAVCTHRRNPSVRMPSKSLRLCGSACGVKLHFQNAKVGWKAFEYKCSAAETEGGKEVGDLPRKRLAIFVSGGGSNFQSMHEATLQGSVHGDVMVLVTDKPGKVATTQLLSTYSLPQQGP